MLSVFGRGHACLAEKETGEESGLLEAQLKSDVAYRLVGVFEQHFRLQQRARIEPLHHRLTALLTDDMRRASRIPAGILLAAVTLVPFIYDDVAMFAVSIATFGILEGFVHTMGIRLFRLKRFYTPGMVTAWLELATSIALITYLAIHHLAHWYDYVCGALMLIICFALMQKTITMMVGVQYSDVPRLLKKQFS